MIFTYDTVVLNEQYVHILFTFTLSRSNGGRGGPGKVRVLYTQFAKVYFNKRYALGSPRTRDNNPLPLIEMCYIQISENPFDERRDNGDNGCRPVWCI